MRTHPADRFRRPPKRVNSTTQNQITTAYRTRRSRRCCEATAVQSRPRMTTGLCRSSPRKPCRFLRYSRRTRQSPAGALQRLGDRIGGVQRFPVEIEQHHSGVRVVVHGTERVLDEPGRIQAAVSVRCVDQPPHLPKPSALATRVVDPRPVGHREPCGERYSVHFDSIATTRSARSISTSRLGGVPRRPAGISFRSTEM